MCFFILSLCLSFLPNTFLRGDNQLGPSSGSWAVVAQWRRYFTGDDSEQSAESEQLEPECHLVERSGRADGDENSHPKKGFISSGYARSAFAAFARETRSSARASRSSSPVHSTNADVGINNQNDASAVVVDRMSERSDRAEDGDLRHMFLAQ